MMAQARILLLRLFFRIVLGEGLFYFFSSLGAKGPAVTIPLGTSAPVSISSNNQAPDIVATNTRKIQSPDGNALYASANIAAGVPIKWGPQTGLQGLADLANASAVTVNILREALALQRYEEARARYGSRYVEYLRYLGVRSSDARLQRPEYLGGGKQTIQFSEVLQTAEGEIQLVRCEDMVSVPSAQIDIEDLLRSTVTSSPSCQLNPSRCTIRDWLDIGTVGLKRTSGKKSSSISVSKRC